jgi:hypothetical protein
MTDTTDSLVAKLRLAASWERYSHTGELSDHGDMLLEAADTIAALEAERDVWEASYTTVYKAGKVSYLEQAARIEALENDVQELTCGDVFLPFQQRIAALEAENFALAANQCKHGVSGEHGDHVCARIKALEAENERLGTENWALTGVVEQQAARIAALEVALREAANIAETACLVPPDGGEPTESERLMCEDAARRIRALDGASR